MGALTAYIATAILGPQGIKHEPRNLYQINTGTEAELAIRITDADPYKKIAGLHDLGERKTLSKKTLEAIAFKLADSDESVRAHTVFALARLGEPVVPLMIKSINDPNKEVANNATTVLAITKAPIRHAIIKQISDITSETPNQDDTEFKPFFERILYVLRLNSQTRNEINLRLLVDTDPIIRKIGIQIATGSIDKRSVLPDKLLERDPSLSSGSCDRLMQTLDVYSLLGKHGMTDLEGLVTNSTNLTVQKSSLYGLRSAPNRNSIYFRLLKSNLKPEVLDVLSKELANAHPSSRELAEFLPLARHYESLPEIATSWLDWRYQTDDDMPWYLRLMTNELNSTADPSDYLFLEQAAWIDPTIPGARAFIAKAFARAQVLHSSWEPHIAINITKDGRFDSETITRAKGVMLHYLEPKVEAAKPPDSTYHRTYYITNIFDSIETAAKRDIKFRGQFIELADRLLSSSERISYDTDLASLLDKMGVGIAKYRSRFENQYKFNHLPQVLELLGKMGGSSVQLILDEINNPKTTSYNRPYVFKALDIALTRDKKVRPQVEQLLDSDLAQTRFEAAKMLADHNLISPKVKSVLISTKYILQESNGLDFFSAANVELLPILLTHYRNRIGSKDPVHYSLTRTLSTLIAKGKWNEGTYQLFCHDLSRGISDYVSPYRRAIIAEAFSHAPANQTSRILKFALRQIDRPAKTMPSQKWSEVAYIAAEDAPSADPEKAFEPFFTILKAYAPTHSLAIQKLYKLLKSPDEEKRLLSIRTLSTIVKDLAKLKRTLEPMLADPSYSIRRDAAFTLEELGFRPQDLGPNYRSVILEIFARENYHDLKFKSQEQNTILDLTEERRDWDSALLSSSIWPRPPKPAHFTEITDQLGLSRACMGNAMDRIASVLPHDLGYSGVHGGFTMSSRCLPLNVSLSDARKSSTSGFFQGWPVNYRPFSLIQTMGQLLLEKPGTYRWLQVVVSDRPYGSKRKSDQSAESPFERIIKSQSMKGKYVYLLEYRFRRLPNGTSIDESDGKNWITAKDLLNPKSLDKNVNH